MFLKKKLHATNTATSREAPTASNRLFFGPTVKRERKKKVENVTEEVHLKYITQTVPHPNSLLLAFLQPVSWVRKTHTREKAQQTFGDTHTLLGALTSKNICRHLFCHCSPRMGRRGQDENNEKAGHGYQKAVTKKDSRATTY